MITKSCRECGHAFTCRQNRTKYCSRFCANTANARTRKGQRPVEAIQASMRRRSRDTREQLRQRFGELSVREIELFKFVWVVAYNRGYGKAYRAQGRQVAA